MDLNEFSDTALKLFYSVFEKLENQVQLINWGYVGAGVFVILFIWMVIDSLIGSQLSPVMIFAVIAFLFLFYLMTRMIGGLL
jgi:apolipoprotein N-acyltransferase